MEHYYYLIADILCLSGPLAFSWDKRTSFHTTWKFLFPAIAFVGFFFIAWDIRFTVEGHWAFNDAYLTGFKLLHLPIEEWLFFLVVPYSCVFAHTSIRYYLPKTGLNSNTGIRIAQVLSIVCLVLALMFTDKAYTFWNYALNALYLGIIGFIWKPQFFTKILISFAFCLIPFLLMNGFLTGSFFSDSEIVWYNDAENLGIRIWPTRIPIEDVMYGFLHVSSIMVLYEFWKSRQEK